MRKRQRDLERTASEDISAYLRSKKAVIVDKEGDVWAVTPKRLFTSAQRALNRALGLHKVNKQGKKKP